MASPRKIVCSGCGRDVGENPEVSGANPLPCRNCGSTERTLRLHAEDSIHLSIKEQARGKVINDSLRSKDRVRREFIVGDEQHRQTGKWYRKERTIDRDNDQYKETIVDPESGEVVHHCEESLSRHRGRGSAKDA